MADAAVRCTLCGTEVDTSGFFVGCSDCDRLGDMIRANPEAARAILSHIERRSKLSTDGVAMVDPDYFYRDMNTCPVGKKVILLTMHGIAVLAEWKRSDTDIIAWSPLPKRRKS